MAGMNRIHPKKLLLSKWTAATSRQKDKHFLVVQVLKPELPDTAIEWVVIEAVMSRTVHRIAWRELKNPEQWRQGWV
jgi:tryptophan-rich hypothetical protein